MNSYPTISGFCPWWTKMDNGDKAKASFFQIPGGTTATNAAAATAATAPGSNKVCGRFFATATDLTASGTVCSKFCLTNFLDCGKLQLFAGRLKWEMIEEHIYE